MLRTSTSHPFGRENEVSIRQLLKFFCNNLYLGQWELARACLVELYDQRALLNLNSIDDILLDVATNPCAYRYAMHIICMHSTDIIVSIVL